MDKNVKVQIEKKNETDWKTIIIAFVAFGLVVGLWLLTWSFIEPEKDPVMRGTIDEMFNANNALFSGLAFAGIIITILLQRRELILQREELKLTRQELARTALAQEESERSLKRQAENLKVSAELSALNTMVSYLTEEIKRAGPARRLEVEENKRQGYINRIEIILERKEQR